MSIQRSLNYVIVALGQYFLKIYPLVGAQIAVEIFREQSKQNRLPFIEHIEVVQYFRKHFHQMLIDRRGHKYHTQTPHGSVDWVH